MDEWHSVRFGIISRRGVWHRIGKMRFKPLIIILLASCVALLGPSVHADTKAGVDAWTRGDYAGAVRQWRVEAARGDADALFNLGQAYKLGKGVKPDLRQAEQLFAQAAGLGHLQASDNYGLLLFQRGERTQALPYIRGASERGDPRAQYLLGIAHFNGDMVPRDWLRAFALMSLAQRQGLPQAASALARMNEIIPLDQRQRATELAEELQSRADSTRARQLAAVDLGSKSPASPQIDAEADSPATAGASYTRPAQPSRSAPPSSPKARDRLPAQPPATALVSPLATGGWRLQLGAFRLASNANALWNKLKGRAELAGHARFDASAGSAIKLQAAGYASRDAAQAACVRLNAAGFTCIAVNN